jgi:hypothetical protein
MRQLDGQNLSREGIGELRRWESSAAATGENRRHMAQVKTAIETVETESCSVSAPLHRVAFRIVFGVSRQGPEAGVVIATI